MALHWYLEWRLTLLTALLFPALLSLGFWQLSRAEEKTQLAAQEAALAAEPARPLAALQDLAPAELAFRRVEVSGHFSQEATLLKDNQLRGGRYGVDVITPFYDRGTGTWVLVNRGWVPADPARQSLPEVETPTGELQLRARAYVPPGEPYVLAEQRFETLRWPLLVQDPGAEALHRALEGFLGAPLFATELRLLPGEAAGFRRDWPIMNSTPDKHRGYAVQWFTMAAALLLLFVLRSSNLAALLRRRKD